MSKSYQPWTQDQAYLLPPSLRDWLPEDHLVWFIGQGNFVDFDHLDAGRIAPSGHDLVKGGGATMGGSFELALSADTILAAERARGNDGNQTRCHQASFPRKRESTSHEISLSCCARLHGQGTDRSRSRRPLDERISISVRIAGNRQSSFGPREAPRISGSPSLSGVAACLNLPRSLPWPRPRHERTLTFEPSRGGDQSRKVCNA